MKLKNKNLEPNKRGKDVKELQDQLKRLNFSIADRVGFFGSETLEAVKKLQKQQGIEPANGIVNEATVVRINQILALQEGPKPNVMMGRILNNNGDVLVGWHVKVVAIDLGKDSIVGQGDTNENGNYQITYESDERLDLQALLFKNSDSRKPLIKSLLILNAKREETINLAIGSRAFRGEPQFKKIETVLSKTTISGSLTDLSGQHRIQLARKTGLNDTVLGSDSFEIR